MEELLFKPPTAETESLIEKDNISQQDQQTLNKTIKEKEKESETKKIIRPGEYIKMDYE